MTKKPKLNVKLLNKVLRHIKAEPRRFNMGTFGKIVEGEPNAPACGTQACIGGWAYLLSLKNATPKRWWNIIYKVNHEHIDIQSRAQKVLGLTTIEATSLFLTCTTDSSFETAKAKIDLLKKDRERFVEEWPY